MRAAVIQLHVVPEVSENLTTASELVRKAAASGATLVVLPEMVDSWGGTDTIADIKSDIPGPVSDHFADLAKELGIWIQAGSIHENIPGESRTYNTALLFNPSGAEIARYRKLHLYDVQIPGRVDSRESNTIAPGMDVVTADIDGHTAGMSICYDLRFPELYRKLVDAGAEIIFLPAAFTLFTGKDHWEVLIRARAIESQSFVLASGQQGVDPKGNATYGRSMIVDPWGTVLATAPDGNGYAIADLDFNTLNRIRQELPSIANRRRDVLG